MHSSDSIHIIRSSGSDPSGFPLAMGSLLNPSSHDLSKFGQRIPIWARAFISTMLFANPIETKGEQAPQSSRRCHPKLVT